MYTLSRFLDWLVDVRTRAVAGLVGATFLLLPTAAGGHPHVWISPETEFQFEDQYVTAVRLGWAFDGFFSAILYEDFDTDLDGVFDESEIEEMRAGAFAGLSEVGFFTDLRIDGEPVTWGLPTDFDIEIREGGAVVVYGFTLRLPEPIDPAAQAVTLSLFDPDFYVFVDLEDGKGLSISGRDSEDCEFDLAEDTNNALYYDSYFPTKATMSCKPGLAG